MKKLTITQPDDWHLHLRDGAALKAVLPYTVRQFARAIIMPNLKPPVQSVAVMGCCVLIKVIENIHDNVIILFKGVESDLNTIS